MLFQSSPLIALWFIAIVVKRLCKFPYDESRSRYILFISRGILLRISLLHSDTYKVRTSFSRFNWDTLKCCLRCTSCNYSRYRLVSNISMCSNVIDMCVVKIPLIANFSHKNGGLVELCSILLYGRCNVFFNLWVRHCKYDRRN